MPGPKPAHPPIRCRKLLERLLLGAAALSLAAGCRSLAPVPARVAGQGLVLADGTDAAGLGDLSYEVDLAHSKIIGSMGAGVAFGDYDGDGDADLYLTQGVASYRRRADPHPCGHLFENDGRGRFREVTERAGLEACGWGNGALFEDADQDGDLDLLLTYFDRIELWDNTGDGRFRERAGELGLDRPGFNCGAAFLDYDRDGDLDLYVARYVVTTLEGEASSLSLVPPLPEDYPAPPNALFRREADGSFVEATAEAGVSDPEGRGLAVVAADLDRDGWTDLYVANDRSRNSLLHNQGDGTFEDATRIAGVGEGARGRWESAMGLAVADVDGNGWLDILVTNYVDEPNTLFLNLGSLVFEDGTERLGLTQATWPWVGWAAGFPDLDNDGWRDHYVVNGHLMPDWVSTIGYWLRRNEVIEAYTKGGFRQPVLFFRGGENGLEVVDGSRAVRLAGRGGAVADVNGDGRLDLFVSSLTRKPPSRLFVNETPEVGRWLEVELRAPGTRPSPLGSWVEVEGAGGRHQVDGVLSGGSYLSGSAVPLHFGVGVAVSAEVEVEGPTGGRRRFLGAEPDHRYVVSVGP